MTPETIIKNLSIGAHYKVYSAYINPTSPAPPVVLSYYNTSTRAIKTTLRVVSGSTILLMDVSPLDTLYERAIISFFDLNAQVVHKDVYFNPNGVHLRLLE